MCKTETCKPASLRWSKKCSNYLLLLGARRCILALAYATNPTNDTRPHQPRRPVHWTWWLVRSGIAMHNVFWELDRCHKKKVPRIVHEGGVQSWGLGFFFLPKTVPCSPFHKVSYRAVRVRCTQPWVLPLSLVHVAHLYLPFAVSKHLTSPTTPTPPVSPCGIGHQATMRWLWRWWTIATGASTPPLLENSNRNKGHKRFPRMRARGEGGGVHILCKPSMPGYFK